MFPGQDPSGNVREPAPPRRQAWLRNKVTTLSHALESVASGCSVGIGGFTLYRRPIAAILELIRRGVRDLSLIDCVASFEADLLIGAGCVSSIRSCYCGMEIFGLAPMFRAAVAAERLVAVQETEATLGYGLQAARAHTDFVPARIFASTDMLTLRSDLKVVESPYSGDRYVAVPAIYPDVSIIHAVAADESGNAILAGNLAVDVDLAAASRKTVLTTERLVPTDAIIDRGADILGGWVDSVVVCPRGAWPTSCLPHYENDMALFADYVEACDAGRFSDFLQMLNDRCPS